MDLTFEVLCQMEPRLRDVEAGVRCLLDTCRKADEPNWCANRFAADVIGPPVEALVGWHRKDPTGPRSLFTSAAFDEVAMHLWDMLPGCRRCLCSPSLVGGSPADEQEHAGE